MKRLLPGTHFRALEHTESRLNDIANEKITLPGKGDSRACLKVLMVCGRLGDEQLYAEQGWSRGYLRTFEEGR